MSRRTKALRRAAFRRFCLALPRYFEARSVPLADRCYGGRCGGTGWLECWCGFCGEEQCYGCRDCRDEVDDGERGNSDDEGDDCDAL